MQVCGEKRHTCPKVTFLAFYPFSLHCVNVLLASGNAAKNKKTAEKWKRIKPNEVMGSLRL